MSRQIHWIDGGISNHAVDRLIKQYNFPGGRVAARKFLRKCKGKEKNARIEIPMEMINLIKGWEIGKKLFIEIVNSKVKNVKEIFSF